MDKVKTIFQQIQNQNRPVSLRDHSISSSLKLLVLAPHPDDFDAIAVTLKHFQENGNQIWLCVLTGASSGVDDAFLAEPTKIKKEEIREKEQKKSLQFFGFPLSNALFLRLPEDQNGDMILDNLCRAVIGQLFQEFNPDVILLPYGKDTNPSHQRIFVLARESAKAITKPIFALYNQDPKSTQIRIDAYVEFEQTTSLWKRKMLRFHQSQHTRNLKTRGCGFDDRILNMNAETADHIDIDSKYAEGFQIELINMPA